MEVSKFIYYQDNTVFKGSTFVINRFTHYLNFVKAKRFTFYYSLLLNFFPGNETNYETKWEAFLQKKLVRVLNTEHKG